MANPKCISITDFCAAITCEIPTANAATSMPLLRPLLLTYALVLPQHFGRSMIAQVLSVDEGRPQEYILLLHNSWHPAAYIQSPLNANAKNTPSSLISTQQ
jgi:hypothetical protein